MKMSLLQFLGIITECIINNLPVFALDLFIRLVLCVLEFMAIVLLVVSSTKKPYKINILGIVTSNIALTQNPNERMRFQDGAPPHYPNISMKPL